MTIPALSAIAAAAVLCLVIFARVPGESMLAAELTNAAHGPAFAVLTWLLFRIGRTGPLRKTWLPLQYAVPACIALALGASVELIQARLGRDASWDDLLRDAQGILAATGWLLIRDPLLRDQGHERGVRFAGVTLAVAGSAMILWPPISSGLARLDRDRSFPVLAQFDHPRALHFVNPLGGATVAWTPPPSTLVDKDAPAHGLRVTTADRAWWGVMLREPVPDWRAYRQLCVTLSNPTAAPLTLELRLYDRASHADAETSVRVGLAVPSHSTRTLRLPFAQMGNAGDLDLAHVHALMLARKGPRKDATEFYVTRLWLE